MARILIVDDQPMNRDLIHAYLEDSGYTLVDAGSGEQALALAEREPPDLVLLDVMMPGLNGFETTRQLKNGAGDKFLPIILLTALSDLSSRVLGLKMGADEFLSKPVDRLELSVRIKNLLALRQKDVALAEKNEALAKLHKFKDEMSDLIIHDLKNPMAAIIANLEYLMDGLKSVGGDVFEAADDARIAAQRGLRLIANLLDVSRLEARQFQLRKTLIDVELLLRTIARQRTVQARARNVDIVVRVDSQLRLEADEDLLTRVFENIVDNAIRYTPAGGRIELGAEVVRGRARIRICNTGSEVPPDARERIFEKFGQAGQGIERMNMGLGLYFCRLASEAHGGRLWLETTPAFPTVFGVELPV